MTLEELDEMIAKREVLSKDLGSEIGIGMNIVLSPRKGYRGPFGKVRTPFGLCEVCCVNPNNEIVVAVTLEQMRRTSKKLHRALAEEHAVGPC